MENGVVIRFLMSLSEYREYRLTLSASDLPVYGLHFSSILLLTQ